MRLLGAAKCIWAGDYEATGQNDPELAHQVQSLQYSLDIFTEEGDAFSRGFIPEALHLHIMFLITNLDPILKQTYSVLDAVPGRRSDPNALINTKQFLQLMYESIFREGGETEVSLPLPSDTDLVSQQSRLIADQIYEIQERLLARDGSQDVLVRENINQHIGYATALGRDLVAHYRRLKEAPGDFGIMHQPNLAL
ncbi:hypothetical protein GQ53DRAFT_834766 [Thozetella sp. PMI_491]|nr:hypothetical protein GQ53DRAFT_834766 [Thozetella sp. PMI_491]